MSITLKEAFRYQNFLDNLLAKSDSYLRDDNNLMKITEYHNKPKAQLDSCDKTKDNISDRQLNIHPDKLINFMLLVYQEKEALTRIINDAKTQHCADMDMSMALNKVRQRIVDRLRCIAALKNRRSLKKASSYCFNADGNQIECWYDVEVTSEAQFDRSKLKQIIKDMSTESDLVSTRIDYYLSSVPVNHKPLFDIHESFEDLVEMFDKGMIA